MPRVSTIAILVLILCVPLAFSDSSFLSYGAACGGDPNELLSKVEVRAVRSSEPPRQLDEAGRYNGQWAIGIEASVQNKGSKTFAYVTATCGGDEEDDVWTTDDPNGEVMGTYCMNLRSSYVTVEPREVHRAHLTVIMKVRPKQHELRVGLKARPTCEEQWRTENDTRRSSEVLDLSRKTPSKPPPASEVHLLWSNPVIIP